MSAMSHLRKRCHARVMSVLALIVLQNSIDGGLEA